VQKENPLKFIKELATQLLLANKEGQQ